MIHPVVADEEPVALKEEGGRAVVVRVGTTIRRAAGWWSPTVQALLSHLNDVGFAYAPQPLGFDEHGREVLSYVEGDHGPACWSRIVTDQGIARFGRLLREYHDAVASFVPPPQARWKLPPLPHPDAIVCHGDFAPWNLVWRGHKPIGIVDWEFARPRHPLDDLAWAAVWSVPLRSDDEAVTAWDCWTAPPDRGRRLRLLLEGYGAGSPAPLVEQAVAVLHQTFEDVMQLAELGMEPQRRWMTTGEAREDLERAAWIERNRQLLV